jgi:rubrerythrin
MTQGPRTREELMAQALRLEREAVARYEELAGLMAEHGHGDVAEVFAEMAQIEGWHVAQILADMGWAEDTVDAREAGPWAGPESPEAVPMDEVEALTHPHNALALALAAEQRAALYFERLVTSTDIEEVRALAVELRAEELEHVEKVRRWMDKVVTP